MSNLVPLSQQSNPVANLILEIDGIDYVFGAIDVERVWRVGDPGIEVGMEGLYVGGVFKHPYSKPVIDMKLSTKEIAQQLQIDSGGTGSVPTIRVALADENGELTELFRSGNVIKDLLGARARCYHAFKGGSHPEDSYRLVAGVIDDIEYLQNHIVVTVSHPIKLEDIGIFAPIATKLSAAAGDSESVISVERSAHFLRGVHAGLEFDPDAVELWTYLKIGDEVMSYIDQSPQLDGSGVFTVYERGALGTIAASHDAGDDVESFYRLSGPSIYLMLSILLSGGEDVFERDPVEITAFNVLSPTTTKQNSILFEGIDLVEDYGLVVGDKIYVTGSAHAENNTLIFGEVHDPKIIQEIGYNELGSYVVVSSPSNLVDEIGAGAQAFFQSQFDILPFGCALTGIEVDIQKFLEIQALSGQDFHSLTFYLQEETNARDFIEEQICKPNGLAQIPVKGKISLTDNRQPLTNANTQVIDKSNIEEKSAQNIAVKRSVNSNFYNTILWKYHYDEIENEPTQITPYISASSFSRIKRGIRPLTIEAKGVRRGEGTEVKIESISKSRLARYQYGADQFDVEVAWAVGVATEIGDAVIFNGAGLNVANSRFGNRFGLPRMMIVTNRRFSFSGRVKLTLLDSEFVFNGRFGVILPSSLIVGAESRTRIKLQGIIGDTPTSESEKWNRYMGEQVLIRSHDWTFQKLTRIRGFDPINPRIAIIDEIDEDITAPLIATRLYLDVPNYDEENAREGAIYKSVGVFMNKRRYVDSPGSDSYRFLIDPIDADDFLVDLYVGVHPVDYADDKYHESQILAKTTIEVSPGIFKTEIRVADEFLFPVESGHAIDLIGFKDGGMPYRVR